MVKFLILLCILALGYTLTMKVIPFLFVRLGRLFGFRMQMNPLTQKRISRFKRIRRGYLSFVILSVLFVTSGFLECMVNHKPLYVRFGDQVAYPAVRDLFRTYVGGLFTISDFDRSADFGIPGETNLDYQQFADCLADPESTFDELVRAKEADRVELREELDELKEELEILEEDGEEPEDWLVDDLAAVEKEFAAVDTQLNELQKTMEMMKSGEAKILWPLYRHSPYKNRLELAGSAPFPPSLWDQRGIQERGVSVSRGTVPLGTDPSGVDVLPQLLYGFRTSVSFALFVLIIGYVVGVLVGATMGFYGGWTDIGIQRFIEIWAAIPFLFTIMIIAEIVNPSFWMLVVLLIVFRSWLAITSPIRGEFYREKARDYVQAAIGSGLGDFKVMTKHILPNSLVPVVSRAPFSFVNYITALVSLDYLGFGLPPGTPSWGAMLRQGVPHLLQDPHLVLIPVTFFALTLLMVVMIGEAVREAFDPKVFSRLR